MNRTMAKRIRMSAGAHGGLPVPRTTLWQRTGGHCWYCGNVPRKKDRRTIDHLLPAWRGGSTEEENLVPSCSACNQEKGWRDLEEYRLLKGGAGHVFWGERPRKELQHG